MAVIRAISPAGVALIKQFESCRLQAYLCPAGKLTIGYGHVLLPMDYALFNVPMARMGEIITINQTAQKIQIPLKITQAQADSLLQRDAANTARFLASVTQSPLNPHQFDALCSFIFNVGQGLYATSTLRKKIDAGDFTGAAAEFPRWVYVTVNGKKQKLSGLVARRATERQRFETPQ